VAGLMAAAQEENGYFFDSLEIECSNGVDTVRSNPFNLEQFKNFCHVLIKKSTDLIFEYSKTPTTTIIDLLDIFEPESTIFCPLFRCEILDATGSTIPEFNLSGFTLEVPINNTRGQIFGNLNLTCFTEINVSKSLSPWTITQNPKPFILINPMFARAPGEYTFLKWEEQFSIWLPGIIDPTETTHIEILGLDNI
jgi:hypothetical protein